MTRTASQTGQPHLTLTSIKELCIPILNEKLQKFLEDTLESIYDLFRLATLKYAKAENLLYKELGLDSFKLEYELCYVTNFSKVFGTHRVDAEYFQPAYEKLIRHISDKGACEIRQIQLFNSRGVQPLYVEDGEIKVVTSKHLGRDSIDYSSLECTTRHEWDNNKNAQIRKFDILIYTTGAYVGRTNCYLVDDEALASNHVNILRVEKLNPVFVSVYLNSVLGQIQVKRCVSGSAQAELYPSDISRFIVWNAPEQTQRKIASLVQQSHEARKKAKELLEEAKRKVEAEIEKEAS